MHESVEVQKKGEMGQGVIAMMDLLLKDLENQLTVGATEEKNAQEYAESRFASVRLPFLFVCCFSLWR